MNSMAASAIARPVPVPSVGTRQRIPWGFPELFVISQTALPALLFLPGSQAFRLPLRFSAFGISLAAFAWWQLQSRDRPPAHASSRWAAASARS